MTDLEVFFSPIAELKIQVICEFLNDNWSVNSKKKFLRKLTKKLTQIAGHPLSCQELTDLPGVYKAVIDRHVSFYCRFKTREIEVITVFVNRQDPEMIRSFLSGSSDFF